MVTLKSTQEIEKLRNANRLVAEFFAKVGEVIEAGISTYDLEVLSEDFLERHNVESAFKGYMGYPANLCVSVNSEVVHGIPREDKVLKEGDIVSIDFGLKSDGFYGDSAKTFPVGKVSQNAITLMKVTEKALSLGIEAAKKGNRLFDIGWTVQRHVEENGFSVVRDFVGHGIGRKLHEEPQVPNFGEKGRGIKLLPGMVLALEPMVNEGTYEVRVKNDGWTVVTSDGKLSAHFEHSVAITENGPMVLSEL